MRTQAHRIDDTDPKRGNVVVRVTGTATTSRRIRSTSPYRTPRRSPVMITTPTVSGKPGQAPTGLSCDLYPLIGSQHLDRSSGSRHWGLTSPVW
jgi:hypothetical protein